MDWSTGEMASLNRFLGLFRKSSSTREPSKLPGLVARDEDLARFVCHSSQLYADGSAAKPGAYLPRDGRTSVFRIVGLEAEAVRALGTTHLRNPAPIAHAVSTAGTILDLGLELDPNNSPERHADIVGWPMRKEEQRLFAVKLAQGAKLVRYAPTRE
jgi:hypothetical protein